MADLNPIYRRIEKAKTPFQVLGVTDHRYFSKVKSAYRSLVLVIHPDKCQPDQAKLHTRLFVKVQEAYEHLSSKRGKFHEEPVAGQESQTKEEKPEVPKKGDSKKDKNAEKQKTKDESKRRADSARPTKAKDEGGDSEEQGTKKDSKHNGSKAKKQAPKKAKSEWNDTRKGATPRDVPPTSEFSKDDTANNTEQKPSDQGPTNDSSGKENKKPNRTGESGKAEQARRRAEAAARARRDKELDQNKDEERDFLYEHDGEYYY